MHGQEVKQGGLHNALENWSAAAEADEWSWAGLWRGGGQEEGRDAGTWCEEDGILRENKCTRTGGRRVSEKLRGGPRKWRQVSR